MKSTSKRTRGKVVILQTRASLESSMSETLDYNLQLRLRKLKAGSFSDQKIKIKE